MHYKSFKFYDCLNLPIVRYLFVGGMAALTDIVIFYVFADVLRYNYLTVTVCGFIIATLVNYLLSIVFVFDSGVRFNWNMEIFFVYVISLVGLSVHISVLYFLVEFFSLMLMVSKLIALGSAFLFNYSLRKYYVFKKKVDYDLKRDVT